MRFMRSKIAGCLLVMTFPVALFAADPPAAMLYSHGVALLNGSNIARSSAIFSGDVVRTNVDSVANISATGSTTLILNDSLVQYEGSAIKLEHGGVTISSTNLLASRVGDVTISPVASVWTEFEVRDVDGIVRIDARKGDLVINDSTGTVTLAEGQQTTRDEDQQSQDSKKKKKKAAAAATPAAQGGILDSPVAVGIGGGAILGVTAWVLLQGDQPASPSR